LIELSLSNRSDVALIKNNARVGSVIAVQLAAEMNKQLSNVEPVGTAALRPTTSQRNDVDSGSRTSAKASGNVVSIFNSDD